MATHDIVVVGASAGGVEALIGLVAGLPTDVPAAIFIVLHIPASVPSLLAKILARAGTLPAVTAEDGMPIMLGQIYVAPPDHHLLLTAAQVRVTHGPRENHCRPALDPLFRTAALAFGPRVVGIVLSGTLNDGTSGLIAIKRRGGVTLVQDPATAIFPSMPLSACTYAEIDGCLPVPDLAAKVVELAHTPVTIPEGAFPVSDELEFEAKIAGLDPSVLSSDQHVGELTSMSCPECKGPLWEIQDGDLLRFRCRVGHAYTAETIVEGQAETVEDSLWMALNTLEESKELYARLAASAQQRHQEPAAHEFAMRAHTLQHRASRIRELLVPDFGKNGQTPPSPLDANAVILDTE